MGLPLAITAVAVEVIVEVIVAATAVVTTTIVEKGGCPNSIILELVAPYCCFY